jgi:hypothetical protein
VPLQGRHGAGDGRLQRHAAIRHTE